MGSPSASCFRLCLRFSNLVPRSSHSPSQSQLIQPALSLSSRFRLRLLSLRPTPAFLSLLGGLSLATLASSSPTATVPEPAHLPKRCAKQTFCPQAYQGNALLQVPIAVQANVLLLGQSVSVTICEYTALLSGQQLLSHKTCVYVGTGGIIESNTNLALSINSAVTCPASLACDAPPASSASPTAPSPVKTCSVKTCPRAPKFDAGVGLFGATKVQLEADVPIGVSQTLQIGNLVGVNVLVCTYTTVHADGLLKNTKVGAEVCIYNAQASVGGVTVGAAVSLSSVVSSTLNLLTGGLTGIAGFGGCPPPVAETCTTPPTSRRRSPVIGEADLLKASAKEAIASRQWNPRKQRVSSPDGALKRRKW